jgi:hypothetical protein
MTDVTVIATTAITGGVAVLTAGIGYLTGLRQAHAEDARQRLELATRRREERRDAYQAMADLLTDYGWSDYTAEDVATLFNKPFLHAANRVRLLGSPRAIAAVDDIQLAFAEMHAAQGAGDEAQSRAAAAFDRGMDALYTAAREDIGPRPEDGLAPATFRRGSGPRA